MPDERNQAYISKLYFFQPLHLRSSTAGFQALWYLSLAEAVAWNGISAGDDTFTFNSGDKAKLTKGGVDLKAAGSEKLSSTKK